MDWEFLCGLIFDWYYDKNYVDVSMPDYIQKLLVKHLHLIPTKPQYSSFLVTPYIPLKKGQHQYAPTPDESALLSAPETTRIQQIIGSLLYYARAIDSTILPALKILAQSQASPTKITKIATTKS